MKTVLFLCTGNYYRSRFAEELFNHWTKQYALNWIAQSRALAIERGKANVGPISHLVVQALKTRGINPRGHGRMPASCLSTDLEAADLIIALKEAEHRPLLAERFPAWEHETEYWLIDDVDLAPPEAGLNAIYAQVEKLVARLRQLA
jgi:protein-tyrosine phosphatase